MQVDLAIEARAENVLAEESRLPRILDRLLHRREQVIELPANVDVGGFRSDCVAADQATLHEQVGIAFHQQVILEGARLALVGVADDVFRLRRLLVDELPLEAGREPRATASAKTGLLHVLDHRLGRHLQGLLQTFVSGLILDVVIESRAAGRIRELREHRLVVRQRLRFRGRRGVLPLADAFLAQVAVAQRLETGRLHAIDEAAHLLRLEVLVPLIVIHHHHRRAIAGAEAFHLLDGEHPGRIGFAGLDAERGLQFFDHALGAGERARQRRAHLQHVLAHRVAVEHHVIRHDVFDFRRRAADHLRHVTHRVVADVTLLFLHEIQGMQHRRHAILRRVMRRELLEVRAVLLRVRKLGSLGQRRPHRAMPLLRAVRHGGMKTHRSTSPITTSSDPITAMTSAIMPPTTNLCSAWHA
jgi:hypothetical protein